MSKKSGSVKEEPVDDMGLVLDCIKEASILYDKNRDQFSIKLPREVCEIFKIEKGDTFRFDITIREGKQVKSSFEIVKRR